jgi:prepilin signal peptidase PulO-like enzyme (type II secretory pathway)
MEEYLIIVGLTCLGWANGKLINFFADVLHGKAQDSKGTCFYCGCRKPIIHYISILYTCPHCSAPYPKRVWMVDILSTITTLFLGLIIADLRIFILTWMVLIYFGTAIITDLEKHAIHHQTNLYGAILCVALGFHLSGCRVAIIGGIAGFLLMAAIYGLGMFYFRWIGQRRPGEVYPSAIGFGDVLLCGNIGLLIGFPKIIPAIFLGIFLAGTYGLFIKIYQGIYSRSSDSINWVPMSPFLIFSAIVIEVLRMTIISS